MKSPHHRCDLKLFKQPVIGLDPYVLIWCRPGVELLTWAGRFSSLKPECVCRCSLIIPSAHRTFQRTEKLGDLESIGRKELLPLQSDLGNQNTFGGKKPKRLTLLLNLTCKFWCSECYCRDVTYSVLSNMIAFDTFLMHKSREGSKHFARMHKLLFGLSLWVDLATFHCLCCGVIRALPLLPLFLVLSTCFVGFMHPSLLPSTLSSCTKGAFIARELMWITVLCRMLVEIESWTRSSAKGYDCSFSELCSSKHILFPRVRQLFRVGAFTMKK